MGHARHALLILALSAGGSSIAAVPDDAVVNERPPVTRAQLEESWGVDCIRLAFVLQGLLDSDFRVIAERPFLQEQVRLCAHLDRVQERDGLPFVHLSKALEILLACHAADGTSCDAQRTVVLQMLCRLDVNQGANE